MSRGAARSAYLNWLAGRMDPPETPVVRGGEALALGYATGYRRPETEAFVRSLRAHHSGPVALFVDRDPEFRSWLAGLGVQALDAAPAEGWTPLPVVARFADYVGVLEARPEVGRVLLTDVRDVVFQGDPFAEPVDALEVFVEDEDHPIGQNRFHDKYIRALVGDAAADRVADRPCLCAGTIIGPANDILRLCRMMLSLIAIPRSGVGAGFGIDQAALEFAVHQGLAPAVVRANHTRVATLGLGARGEVAGDRVANPDGSFSPIVHQYDRQPELMALVRRLWNGEAPDRVRTGPQGLARAKAKLRATLSRYLPEAR